MKKALLAFLVATGVATVSQASAVNWNAAANSAVENLQVYLVLNEDLPTKINSISDITGNASDNAKIVKNGRNYNTGDQTLDNLDTTKYKSGDSIAYTLFVVSENSYYTLGSKTATVYNDLSDPPESGNNDGGVSNTSVPAVGGSGWTVIPEPTTVALLALGLAAFGLKRKVA